MIILFINRSVYKNNLLDKKEKLTYPSDYVHFIDQKWPCFIIIEEK